eukprot:TRINITY_DN2105_c0_g1_i1.p1 TRINITY_DN2105_c0_g1~~TRINITY_DN2105_c0_g1_i1.p1  ORF type:complete len:1315 (+),score=189.80 TRINITY_DN2105_c0_g1_i1:225-4169(+)
MPFACVTLLLFISSYLASHAQLTEPRFVAASCPPTLSAFTPHNLTIILTKPLLSPPRLQLFSSPQRTLLPVSASITPANNVALVFRLPPLPPSQPPWQLQLRLPNNTRLILTHPVKPRIIIVPPPSILSIHPRVLHRSKTSLLLLTGTFPPNPRVFIHNRRVPPRRIPSVSSTQIIVRVRPSSAVSQLSFSVLSVDGVRSPALNVSVRHNLIPISAVALHASYQYTAAHYVLSSLCANSTPIVHFHAHALLNAQLPVFNVSYRTSNMAPASFKRLQTFSSSTVLSLPDHLFSQSNPPDHMVTVVITCAHAGRVGQTLLFISQKRSAQVFGISVFPHVHQMVPLHRTAVLRASISPTYCSRTAQTSVQLIWRVNNTIVQPLQNASQSLHAVSRPATTGLANTLVVPVEGRFVYVVQAVLQHTVTGKVIARAAATGVAVVRKSAPLFKAVLNGAASAITLPPGVTDYPIHVDVYEQSQYGVLFESQARVLFQWSCAMFLDDIESPCTSQLFSPWLATESSETSSFQISTVGVEAETRVLYTVLVFNNESAFQRLNLTLNIAPREEQLGFPPEAMLHSASRVLPHPVADEEPSFRCFESIILSWTQNISQALNFQLFRDGQEAEVLSNATEGAIISYDGYWTKDTPFGRFFGLSASLLSAGSYSLYGAVNKTAGPGMGTSWRFNVQNCPTLVVSNLPITTGTTNQTVFHASAYSLPSSDNLYAFILSPEESMRTIDTAGTTSERRRKGTSDFSSCLDGCTGKPAVSFTVSRAGRYKVIVEMYDPSGSYLLGSESSNSTITVADGIEDETEMLNESVVEVLNATLQHRDESRFVDTLLSIQSSNVSLDAAETDLLTAALKQVSSSPAVNALQCTQYVRACAGLLGFETLNSTHVANTLGIIDVAVQQSIWSGSPGFHLREALKEFYSTATRSVHHIARTRLADGTDVDAEVREIAERTRKSAARAIPLVLSAGRTCGVVDSERVDMSGMVEVDESDERDGAEVFDDYRIGVSCFPGQIKRLTPEPATVQTCAEASDLKREDDGSIYVLSSVEQHNVLERSLQSGTLDGPQVEVSVFQQVEQRGQISVVRMNGAPSDCYGTRVSVYATRNVSETFSLLDGQRVSCADAGTVTEGLEEVDSLSNGRQAGARMVAREFEFDSERNRVSAVVEGALPVRLKLQVNGTRLSECIRLSGGSVNGRHRAASVAIWVPVVGVVVLGALVTVCVVWRVRVWRKGARSERRGGGGWNGRMGTADEESVGDGMMSSSSSEAEVSTGVGMRFAARGETGSIGCLEDERNSAGSSLLTATASHTTSSSEGG